MRHSEFWQVVDEILGPAYGRSVARDLVLSAMAGRTATEALGDAEPPQRVWEAVCDELDLDESARWHHRIAPRR